MALPLKVKLYYLFFNKIPGVPSIYSNKQRPGNGIAHIPKIKHFD